MWRPTGVRPKRLDRVRDWLSARGMERVGEIEFALMRSELSDIPEPALRKLLRETGVALAPVVEGVRQDTFDNLGRTLAGLQQAYQDGDAAVRRNVRAMVITAKDHAKLAARRKPEKIEMVEWMLVWLENPPVFETWLRLRLSARTPGNTDTGADPASS
jgi:hypothetical protein